MLVNNMLRIEVEDNGTVKDINTPICRIGSCHACVKTNIQVRYGYAFCYQSRLVSKHVTNIWMHILVIHL